MFHAMHMQPIIITMHVAIKKHWNLYMQLRGGGGWSEAKKYMQT